MGKLFKPKPTTDKRSVRYAILLTEAESDAIATSAKSRSLSVAEFIRRAALGRPADRDYKTEAVLALSAITREIRLLHGTMVEQSQVVQEECLAGLIALAGEVMLQMKD